ncbi:MAG: binding domain protein, partial [Thermoleophilia bacterium]|nr:binding domain protein [Thermoleophilia bacterium]
IDGLIHISELSWSHVNHPNEVIEIGQTVQVKVLDIDRDRQRISLGLKQTREDPWQKVLNDHQVGDELEGVVTKAVTFGAFVELFPGVEGLVHISELSWEHVENPREVVNPGDKVKAKLIEIDPERRRISLSIKQTTERPENLESDDDFVPIDAAGEGIDLDGPSTSMAAALREAAARATEGDETEATAADAAPVDAPPVDESVAATADGEAPPEVTGTDAPAASELAVEEAVAEIPADDVPVAAAPVDDPAKEAAVEAGAGEPEIEGAGDGV